MPVFFDAEALGARCSKCFLRTVRQGGPIGPELSRRAKAALIGEAPGKEEIEEGRPFIGPSGHELTSSLASVGIARDDVSILNAIACRPPGNDLETLLHKCQQTNKRLVAAGQEPWLNPIEACRPLMQHYLQPFNKIITVGKTAMRSVTQTQSSIMDMRGAPVTGVLSAAVDKDGVRPWLPRETLVPDAADLAVATGGSFIQMLPTIHPSFVMRQRRWTKVFRADLARAFRWFSGNLGWKDPRMNLRPTLSEARDFLYSGAPFYAYDVETDAKESLLARLRCIGFGTPDSAIVVPLLSVDGRTRFYTEDEEGAMLDMLRAWFTDRRIVKVGWNAGYYDRIVIETRLGVTPVPLVDGMLIHRNVDSELPHNLAFVGALFTDVARAWKASHAATSAQSDEELHVYNVGDCVVNARIMQPLVDACTMREQMQVVEVDHKAQAICAGLHRNGIFVDQAIRQQLDEKYRKEAHESLHILKLSVGDANFNPNSVLQVRDLLFDRWGLTPLETTKLGDPSTNDDTLRKLLLLKTLRPEQGDFLRNMRKFRRAVKFRGTFIRPLRPFNEPVYEDDPYAVDANTVEGAAMLDEIVTEVVEDVQGDLSPRALRRALKKAAGKVLADGRVHSNWNAHVATTGRLSSSEPNVQNIVRALRGMFRAEDGRGLVASDYDQLELRISAAYAQADRYLQAFKDGKDPHAITSEAIYGDMFRNGSEKDKKRIRDFAKRFVYAVIYGATVETIHETIAAAENDKGELIFPWVTLRETDTLVRRWMKENPEYARWWESTINTYRRDGFLAEPVLGRRRFFLDGEDRNEIINYRVQAAGASCVTKASIALTDGPLKFERWGPGTGLIQNGHDALMAEAPCVHLANGPYKGKDMIFGGHPPLAKGEHCPLCDAAQAIGEAMTMKFADYDVTLTATPKIGVFWSQV